MHPMHVHLLMCVVRALHACRYDPEIEEIRVCLNACLKLVAAAMYAFRMQGKAAAEAARVEAGEPEPSEEEAAAAAEAAAQIKARDGAAHAVL